MTIHSGLFECCPACVLVTVQPQILGTSLPPSALPLGAAWCWRHVTHPRLAPAQTPLQRGSATPRSRCLAVACMPRGRWARAVVAVHASWHVRTAAGVKLDRPSGQRRPSPSASSIGTRDVPGRPRDLHSLTAGPNGSGRPGVTASVRLGGPRRPNGRLVRQSRSR